MTIRAVAPASTANLGPGFDTAAAALALWNDVVVEESPAGLGLEIDGEGADELPRDDSHLTLRAFSLFRPVDGYSFRFVNRIPLERGLGSSAAAIALGLVAGAAAAGRRPAPAELLGLGEQLEGHADNLAAVLLGGVSLTWVTNGERRVARVAPDLPLAPILVVPATRTSTVGSRNGLPASVPHGDATVTVAHAALLGAGIAASDPDLLAEAFADRLHEQYRLDDAPLLGMLRERTPEGAVGVTLSGSGPSVVVWARPEQAAGVAQELEHSLDGDATVLALSIAREGARLT